MNHRAVALTNYECPIPAIHNKYSVPVFTFDDRWLPSERFNRHLVGLAVLYAVLRSYGPLSLSWAVSWGQSSTLHASCL